MRAAVGVLILAALAAPPVEAAPVVLTRQEECATRNGQKTCRRIGKTGTVIGRHSDGRVAVLTCAHGVLAGAPFLVQIEAGGAFEAAEFRGDRSADVGLALVAHAGRVESLPIAASAEQPAVGAKLTAGGWFESRYQAAREMTCTGLGDDGLMLVDRKFGDGESGGPAVCNGRVVGVVCGNTSRGQGVLTGIVKIREFLAAELGAIPGEPRPAPALPAVVTIAVAAPEPPPTLAPQLPMPASVNTADLDRVKNELIGEIRQVTVEVVAEIARVAALVELEQPAPEPVPTRRAAGIGGDATGDAVTLLLLGSAFGFFVPRLAAKIRRFDR